MKLFDLRKQQYDYHKDKFPFLFDYTRNPYSFIKGLFYYEMSALLVYFLLKTKIKPNTITMLYCLSGIATGILFSMDNRLLICTGIFIAFTKGILDFSDGHLARITGQQSLTGHILDVYGALLNGIGLQIGLGFYIVNKLDITFFYYLIPLLIVFRVCNLFSFSKEILFEELPSLFNNSSSMITNIALESEDKNQSKSRKIYLIMRKFIFGVFDDRARSVDFICLIVLLELFSNFNISWIIFLIILMKYFLIFIISFYNVGKGGWVENIANKKLAELYIIFSKSEKTAS